jgi:hypothetical protein
MNPSDVPGNSIFVIFPYRAEGTWVFDDERVGLVREPFIAGVPEIIDGLVASIPNADKGFKLLFSPKPFPGARRFEWLYEESEGNWYRDAATGAEGWLCPALFKYFAAAPRQIYAKAEVRSDGHRE